MAVKLPPDFKEFLRLLNASGVRYLLIGGYAVGYHGYPRATGDIDIWIAVDQATAEKMVRVLRQFGFDDPELDVALFLTQPRIIRLGLPPTRIEICTAIDGVAFEECFADRVQAVLDGETVSIISLAHLRQNKLASGRLKDLADLEQLPDVLS